MIAQANRGHSLLDSSRIEPSHSRNLSMDSCSVALFSSYGENDCIQEISVSPVWRFVTEQPVNIKSTVYKEKKPARYNFNSFLAKNRIKAGQLMKVKAQGAVNMVQMRQKLLKLLVYMNHAEKEIEYERKLLAKNHENNIKYIANMVFGRSDRVAFLGLKNKLEMILNTAYEPTDLKICLLRVQKEVAD